MASYSLLITIVVSPTMHRFLHWVIFVYLINLLLLSCDSSENIYPIVVEHPPEIEQALINAKQKPKGVLIIFGADWCPPCRQLYKMLDQIDVKNDLQPLYEIVKIDIGNWDKNIDTAKKYGNPVRQGIPGIVLLNQDGSIREIIEYKEFSSLIKGGPDVLTLYLQES